MQIPAPFQGLFLRECSGTTLFTTPSFRASLAVISSSESSNSNALQYVSFEFKPSDIVRRSWLQRSNHIPGLKLFSFSI
jgi:hypothetical protein